MLESLDDSKSPSPSNRGKVSSLYSSQADEGNPRLIYLKKTLGLSHDPFAFGVTEQELGGPPEEPYFFSYYVEPPSLAPDGGSAISWLRESQHALVFGAPGTGKTALRLTLEAECRSTFGGPKTLAVTYLLGDDFTTPPSSAEHWQRLAQAMATDLLIQVIEQFNPLITAPTNDQITILRRQLAIVSARVQHLLLGLAIRTEVGLEQFWPSLGRPAVRFVPWHLALGDLLARLRSERVEQPTSSGQALLQEGLAAARAWDFQQVFVLVDEVDARQREPATMLALIKPLLDSRAEWAKAGLYCKLFLSDDLEDLINNEQTNLPISTLRSTIHWQEADLAALLLRRFTAAGANLASVDMLAGPGLTGRLTASLIRAAEGSPRRLLNLISALIDAHCQRNPAELLLDTVDWEAMRHQLSLTYDWDVPTPVFLTSPQLTSPLIKRFGHKGRL